MLQALLHFDPHPRPGKQHLLAELPEELVSLALACVLCRGYNDEQGIMCPSSNSSLARDVLDNKALVGLDCCPRGREIEKLAGRGSWGRMQRLFLENVCAIPSLPCPSATLDLSCKNWETIVFAAPPLLRVLKAAHAQPGILPPQSAG